jgi:hypothetical protein
MSRYAVARARLTSRLVSRLKPRLASPLPVSLAAGGRGAAATALAVIALAPLQPATAQVAYSDDPNAPTLVTADSLGRYIFDGQVGNVGSQSQKDFITINVPSGMQISSINLDYYDAVDDRAFVSFQSGSQYTANQTTGAGALAYNHFGWRGLCATTYGSLRPTAPSANYNCTNGTTLDPLVTPASTNLLSNLYVSTTNPSQNSPTPGVLGAGTYTFWIQQISGDSRYTFTVQTSGTAAPGPLPLAGAAAAFGWSRRLRRRLNGQPLV